MTAEEKTWPSDAVMIVCATPEETTIPAGAPRGAAICRTCGEMVVFAPETLLAASKHPDRFRRPIDFFCVNCAILHNPETIESLVDMRRAAERG